MQTTGAPPLQGWRGARGHIRGLRLRSGLYVYVANPSLTLTFRRPGVTAEVFPAPAACARV